MSAPADRVAFLVDGDEYFRAFREAALRAERVIRIVAWDFHSRTRLVRDAGPGEPPAALGAFLNFLARRRRGLHIYVLDWDYPIVFGHDRELPPRLGLGWRPHHRVHLRYDDTHPVGGSHHQKIVVIDDSLAFCGGLDLTERRWDTPAHRADDPSRVTSDGVPYAPFHDAMLALSGPMAGALATVARERWSAATGRPVDAVRPSSDPWPSSVPVHFSGASTALALTMPPAEDAPPVRQVEQLYLDMIAAARELVYIENQYFTARRIVRALAARLAEPGGPEIVVVLRLMSHGWLEEYTMHVLRASLIRELRAADREGRFHVYYPHVDGLAAEKCIDVHAKLMCVDDRWLRVGSSNICNRSMGLDSECDLAIEADLEPHRRAVRAVRTRLLAEHLGEPPETVAAAIATHGSLHRAIAALGSPGRRLAPLEEVPEWGEPMVAMAAVADLDEPISTALEPDEADESDGAAPPRRNAWAALRRLPIHRNTTFRAIVLTILVVGLLTALWRETALAETVTPEAAMRVARALGDEPWAPLVVLAAYTPASVVMFPRPLITLAAVIAFGPLLGFVYALAGILVAAGTAYWVGRRVRPGLVRRWAGTRTRRLINLLRRRGLAAITLVRLVPIAPFAVESAVAGAVRIRFALFLAGTALGMLPGTLATTVFADRLDAMIAASDSTSYAIGAAIVVFMIAVSLIAQRWLRRAEATPAGGGAAASPSADAAERGAVR